jgi:predicted nucleic acid-binding protein
VKLLIDTNIILDHLLDRKPFNEAAAWIFTETEHGQLEAFLGGTTITTVHYLIAKELGAKAAHTAIEQLLRLFEIAPITRTVLASALLLKFADFEDAVLHEAAVHIGAEAIVSRDRRGFKKASIAVYSPDELVNAMVSESENDIKI